LNHSDQSKNIKIKIYKAVMLPVISILYGCEIHIKGKMQIKGVWEKVYEKLFGPKRAGVTEGWTKLLNEKLHNLYSELNIAMIQSRRRR
jgi:hypothetical protein